MNRRQFIKSARNQILAGMLVNGLLPPSFLSKEAAGAGTEPMFSLLNNDLSLRDIAEAKRHHGDGRYLNPFNDRNYRNLSKIIYWKLFCNNRYQQYYDEEPHNPVSIDWTPVRNHRNLSVTFLNHASLLIKDRGRYFLVDPVFFGISRLFTNFTPLAFDLGEMPKPDHILVTHGHYDHLDKSSLAFFDPETHVVTPLGYHKVFNDLGMKKRTQLDWFETVKLPFQEITLLPCNHWTMRNPIVGPNRSLWGSFLIRTSNRSTIYIAGDTGYFHGFKELGNEYDIDLAIFNLGAYEPRWFMAASHMDPADTIKAFKELKAKRFMVVHWGTFRLGDEPVHFPPVDLERELVKQGLLDRLVKITHGQTLFLD